MKEVLFVLVRHGLGFVGGSEFASDEMASQVVGALMVLGPVLWSLWEKGHFRKRPGAGGTAGAVGLA